MADKEDKAEDSCIYVSESDCSELKDKQIGTVVDVPMVIKGIEVVDKDGKEVKEFKLSFDNGNIVTMDEDVDNGELYNNISKAVKTAGRSKVDLGKNAGRKIVNNGWMPV